MISYILLFSLKGLYAFGVVIFFFKFCILLNIWCVLNTRVIYEFGLIMRFYFSSMMWWCIFCWQCKILLSWMLRVFWLLESSWWNLMKILDERDAMFGLVWLFGFMICVFKPRMKCDYNASVLIECDAEYYWTCFNYEFILLISLFMVSLPLFVCLCVCCLCDDRITCVLYGSRR